MRDLIKSLKRVPASRLIPNPRNFQTHGADQKSALVTLLENLGFVRPVVAREVEGGLQLIDGELRRDAMGDEKIPVLVLDVDEKTADLILASKDPIMRMADVNATALNNLIDAIETEAAELGNLLDKFAVGETLEIEGAGEQPEADEKVKFRTWGLPVGPEHAEMFATKLAAYMDQHGGTCLGLAERMLDAVES